MTLTVAPVVGGFCFRVGTRETKMADRSRPCLISIVALRLYKRQSRQRWIVKKKRKRAEFHFSYKCRPPTLDRTCLDCSILQVLNRGTNRLVEREKEKKRNLKAQTTDGRHSFMPILQFFSFLFDFLLFQFSYRRKKICRLSRHARQKTRRKYTSSNATHHKRSNSFIDIFLC